MARDVWLAPLLTSKAHDQAAYANMDVSQIGDYDQLKKSILKRYDINEGTYRQRFRSSKKGPEKSYSELGIRLQDLFTKWMQQVGKSKEVCNAVALEQLMKVIPQDLRVWLKERKPKSVSAAAEMADNYMAARRERRVCSICSKPGHITKFCCSLSSSTAQDKQSGEVKGNTESAPEPKITSGKGKTVTCF